MKERYIVDTLVRALQLKDFKVATEVANLYRSADIAAIDNENNIWVVECKISNISQAIEQSRIHKLSAERVFIAMPHRKMQQNTIKRIKAADLGLIYVMPDGSMKIIFQGPVHSEIWKPARNKLQNRIMEAQH